ncbi:MAG: thioester dehydrase [Spirochaetia bacterium]|nr:thioester dehydrase [Spirochaetia bacterium]
MIPIEKDELINLLPHKGRMFLLDRAVDVDYENYSIKTQVDVTENSMFYDKSLGGIPSYITFEYMAQSISALSGFANRRKGLPPKVGVILSVSDFKTFVPVLKAGTTGTIADYHQDVVDRVFSFDCKAYVGDTLVSSGKLTVMDIDDLSELGI